jgi:ABC-2 type transport system ATP-binding protein
VSWALDWTGLAPRADESTERFSGGMRRRLNIACGVLHRPEVILLDEPTVGVDPQSRERIYEMLALLRADGASLLLTTHQLEEAEARCDRIVIIDHGGVVASGTLGELTAKAFGHDHRVTFNVDHIPAELPPGVEPGGNDDGHVLRASIGNVAAELPEMVRQLAAAGAAVEGLDVRRPGLADVFIHLTGRELRE